MCLLTTATTERSCRLWSQTHRQNWWVVGCTSPRARQQPKHFIYCVFQGRNFNAGIPNYKRSYTKMDWSKRLLCPSMVGECVNYPRSPTIQIDRVQWHFTITLYSIVNTTRRISLNGPRIILSPDRVWQLNSFTSFLLLELCGYLNPPQCFAHTVTLRFRRIGSAI